MKVVGRMDVKPIINTQEKPEYLRFDFEGTTPTAQVGIEYFSAVAEECKKRGHKKALVVESLKGPPPIIEVFDLSKKLPDLFRGLKIAYVLVGSEHYSMIQFGEDVAVNRGTNAKVFQNEREAEQWLTTS